MGGAMSRAGIGWREALRAVAEDARTRSDGTGGGPYAPSDPRSVGWSEGASWAFRVIAEECAYLALKAPGREGLEQLRKLIDRANARALGKAS